MLEIDGGQYSGSGTIVRYGASLAALLGQELHLTNIRAKRPKPGLRRQHLKAVEILAEITRGSVIGGHVGSSDIIFRPGATLRGGERRWDIGTAGSTTMLAFSLLPVAAFASEPCAFELTGGLFQDFAPSAFHMQSVLLPMLGKMGLRADITIVRPGYVPKGGGVIDLKVEPIRELHPLVLGEKGKLLSIKGIALSSHLKDKKVSERMARACQSALKTQGHVAEIEIVYDETALQEGAALALFAETDHGTFLGADMAGRLGRRSEEIGRKVAQILMEDLETKSSVDRYVADQLILFAALARGRSRFKIPRVTEHVVTNLWLVEQILGAKASLEHNWIEIEGACFEKLAV